MFKTTLKNRFRILNTLLLVIGSFLATASAETNFQLPMSYPVLYADFTQERLIQGLKNPITSEGTMIVSQKEGLFWKQRSPFAMTMQLTPKKMVSQVGNGRKEIITAKDNPMLFQFNHLLSALFTMNVDAIAQYFAVESIVNSHKGEVITLKPITSPVDKIFKNIILTIKEDIQSVILIDLQGDRTELYFHNHEGLSSLKEQDVKIFQ